MSFDAAAIHQLSHALGQRGIPLAPRFLARINLMLFSAYLPPEVDLGNGTVLGYGGLGIFIHPRARIGRHCLISQFVSIGGGGGREGAPEVGDYARIAVGARILGPVRIGPFAVVGANTVVTRDVPPGAVVFGIPARVVRTIEDPVMEYERDTGRRVDPEDRLLAPLRVRTPELAEPLPAAESFLEAVE